MDQTASITQQLAHLFIQLGMHDAIAALGAVLLLVGVPVLVGGVVAGLLERRAQRRERRWAGRR